VDRRQVESAEAIAMARRWNVPYVEATAKENVDHIFAHLLYDMEAARGTIVLPSGAVIITLSSTTPCACVRACVRACVCVCGVSEVALATAKEKEEPPATKKTEADKNSTWQQDMLALVNEPSSADIRIFIDHRTYIPRRTIRGT
jgi:hypothetical protein